MRFSEILSESEKQRLDPKCWKGYKKQGTKIKGGVRVNNCVPKESVEEDLGTMAGAAALGSAAAYGIGHLAGKMINKFDKKYDGVDRTTARKHKDSCACEKCRGSDNSDLKKGVAEGLEDTNVQDAIFDTVKRLFYKNEIGDYGALEAIRQGIKHHFSKPGATVESAIDGILNILDKRRNKGDYYLELTRFKEALRQGVAHQLKKQGVAEETTDVYRKVFKKNGKPVGEIGIDLDASPGLDGEWYVKHYASGTNYSGYTRQDAIDELKYMVSQGLDEDYNAEYDDEAGMADNNLETLERAIQGIDDLIHPGDNLPEWCQEKIAIAKSMLVNVWDYMRSEEDRGAVAEDWQKANRKDKTPGMSKKAVAAYRREHPGSKLQTAVTTKPSKLKKGSKASKRRKSYCSRSKGQMDMHNIDCSKTPDKAICKSRRRWNCE